MSDERYELTAEPATYPEPTEPGWYWFEPIGLERRSVKVRRQLGKLFCGMGCTTVGEWTKSGTWGPRVPEWRSGR